MFSSKDRIYILPSRQGIYFLSLSAILFFISLSYAHNLAFAVTTLFICLGLVSAVYTNFNLAGVELKNFKVWNGPVGEAYIEVHLVNKGRRKKFDLQVLVGQFCGQRDLSLGYGECSKFIIPLDLSRGLYSFKRFKLRTTFPFGIFVAWKFVAVRGSVCVYPQESSHGFLPEKFSPKGAFDDGLGEMSRGGQEFSGHKTYVEGEPWRHIDWKAWARERGPLSKIFESPKATAEVFDFSKIPLKSDEQKLEQIAWWINQANKCGISYKLILPGKIVNFGRGQSQLQCCTQALALYQNREKFL